MPTGLGPRFLVEAGFIIAVAAVAGVERFRTVIIITVVAASWAIVAVVEVVLELRRRVKRRAAEIDAQPVIEAPPPRAIPVEPSVRVLRAEREPEPAPDPIVTPGPTPEPQEPEAEPAPQAPTEPEPPKPAPAEPRVLAAAPPPPPPPEREPEPEPEPEPTVVSLESRRPGPREWNVWDLERLAREQVSDDAARNEERSYLLMYLREFANADGMLPADFDGVVRETFGDVLDAAYSS